MLTKTQKNHINAKDLLEACEAGQAYDEEIQKCGNDPDRMASHCTAQGDTLDALYLKWITLTRTAVARAKGGA